jgi:NADPH-dependent ferric siderophore reductase
MIAIPSFKLNGCAIPVSTDHMLDEICEHFVEHADVERKDNQAVLRSKAGLVKIRADNGTLRIELDCPTLEALQAARTDIAEHLFYFAGEQPLQLSWMPLQSLPALPNLHEITVVSASDVTPHMRRVIFSCADVTPFAGGDMHVRLLVPPQDRPPVWPGFREDGRIAWPDGDNALLVRVYTIRAIDIDRGEIWIDFLQHPVSGISTPGADFARDARIGDRAALLGPGGGGLPSAKSILLIGDESALPAIARIASEVPADTQMRAIIEVENEAEEQPLPTDGRIEINWLHRCDYHDRQDRLLLSKATDAIAGSDTETFVWAACEKDDIRAIRAVLKGRRHDHKKMYVAWYWERGRG